MDYHLLEQEQLQALTPRYVAMKVVTVKPDQKHLLFISSVALLNLYRGDHKGSLCHILVRTAYEISLFIQEAIWCHA